MPAEIYTMSSPLYTMSHDIHTISLPLYAMSHDINTISPYVYTMSTYVYTISTYIYAMSHDIYTMSPSVYTMSHDIHTILSPLSLFSHHLSKKRQYNKEMIRCSIQKIYVVYVLEIEKTKIEDQLGTTESTQTFVPVSETPPACSERGRHQYYFLPPVAYSRRKQSSIAQ